MQFRSHWRKHFTCYRFLKNIFGPADIPMIFHAKKDQGPVWLYDITVVTQETEEEHTRKLYPVHTKIEVERYRAIKKSGTFYQKETVWLEHTI